MRRCFKQTHYAKRENLLVPGSNGLKDNYREIKANMKNWENVVYSCTKRLSLISFLTVLCFFQCVDYILQQFSAWNNTFCLTPENVLIEIWKNVKFEKLLNTRCLLFYCKVHSSCVRLGGFKVPHQTCISWIVDHNWLQTICDVTNSACKFML